MKRCNGCDETKPLDQFYRRGRSRTSRCKACMNARSAAWKKAHPDRAREISRAACARHFKKSAARHRATIRRWEQRHPQARYAYLVVARALKRGRLIRAKACEECGGSGRLHAHHEDYARPLDVRWLCPPCHVAHHEKAAGGNE